jgi:aspartyl protease family protein
VSEGPWNRPPEGGQWRFLLWIAVIVAGAAGVWLLFRILPGQNLTEWDSIRLVSLLVILATVSTAVLTARRFKAGEVARNVGIWAGIVLVLIVGFTFQDELGTVWQRVKGEFVPGAAVETAPNVMTITADRDGSYYVYGDVQGSQVKFLVDTGASHIVLSPADARRAGIDVDSLSYRDGFETANGMGRGADVRLASIQIGSIRFTDVPAIVNRADMSASLLGMTFLNRLEAFEFRGRRLILRAR